MKAHSPLPWLVESADDEYTAGITAANGDAVVWITEQDQEGLKNPADAAFIVAACNNVERLADACRAMVDASSETDATALAMRIDRAAQSAREALAQFDLDRLQIPEKIEREP